MKTNQALAARLIKAALASGASLAEVYQRSSSSLSADVKQGALEAAGSSTTFGYGLRLVKSGRPGFSYSNNPDDESIVLESALAVSNHTTPDETLGLPVQMTTPVVRTFDPEVEASGEEAVLGLALSVEKGARDYDPRITKIRKASATLRASDLLIMNSLGLEQAFSATSCAASIMAVAEVGDEAQLGWGFYTGRFFSEVDFKRVGKDAARRATRMLGARRAKSGKYNVLLDPSVATEFLSVFSSMLSAENVQKGRSLLKGRLGQRVLHKALSILDNGLLPDGPARRPFDDEGVPVRENVLIKDGVLLAYLHDTHSANKDKTESTGSAVRGGPQGIPSVGPVSMYFMPARDARTHLHSELDQGLYVTDAMGVHTINPVSGDFSIGVSGLWYQGGTPAYPVKEAVIGGNVLDIFSNVISIGDDLTFYGSMGSPSLLLGPVDLSA